MARELQRLAFATFQPCIAVQELTRADNPKAIVV